jgi:hypothetical protein
VDIPAWGIGVIALYSLLQIPAVVLVARYCEVDPGNLPTPPMRARWRDGDPQQSRNPSATEEQPRGEPPVDSENRSEPPDPERSPESPGVARATDGGGSVRCSNCGEKNDTAFTRCQRCVSEL